MKNKKKERKRGDVVLIKGKPQTLLGFRLNYFTGSKIWYYFDENKEFKEIQL